MYVTHDSGAYDRLSPLSARVERFVGGESLEPALELWSRVLARPEPGLAILGVGHRETPSRLGMPVPLLRRSDDGRLQPIDATTASISGMNDHHAYLRLAPSDGLAVGDLVGLGISHPCEAFEKWRTVIAVDEDRVVLRSLQTQF